MIAESVARASRNITCAPRIFGDSESIHESLGAHLFCAPSTDPKNAIVEVKGSPFHPTVNAGDLLCVNFTIDHLTYDGLYVITFADWPSKWIGIRRFQITGDGWRIYQSDDGGDWRLMSDEEQRKVKVLGRVDEVFKKDRGKA